MENQNPWNVIFVRLKILLFLEDVENTWEITGKCSLLLLRKTDRELIDNPILCPRFLTQIKSANNWFEYEPWDCIPFPFSFPSFSISLFRKPTPLTTLFTCTSHVNTAWFCFSNEFWLVFFGWFAWNILPTVVFSKIEFKCITFFQHIGYCVPVTNTNFPTPKNHVFGSLYRFPMITHLLVHVILHIFRRQIGDDGALSQNFSINWWITCHVHEHFRKSMRLWDCSLPERTTGCVGTFLVIMLAGSRRCPIVPLTVAKNGRCLTINPSQSTSGTQLGLLLSHQMLTSVWAFLTSMSILLAQYNLFWMSFWIFVSL